MYNIPERPHNRPTIPDEAALNFLRSSELEKELFSTPSKAYSCESDVVSPESWLRLVREAPSPPGCCSGRSEV